MWREVRFPVAMGERDFSPQLWDHERKRYVEVSKKENPECPHCGQKTEKWAVPEASTWDDEFHYVCFNDECPYFVKGWNWMEEKYKAKASYRYCVDPASGHARPLPVWSNTALKNDIIYDNNNLHEGENQEAK